MTGSIMGEVQLVWLAYDEDAVKVISWKNWAEDE